MKLTRLAVLGLAAFCSFSPALAKGQDHNPNIGVGPVHLSQANCELDPGIYTPSQTAIRLAEQSGRRNGLVRAFPEAPDSETTCMIMHTSVRAGPNGEAKAPDGTRPGDFWVRGYTKYLVRRAGQSGYVYWLCLNDVPKVAQPTEVATRQTVDVAQTARSERQVVTVPQPEVEVLTMPTTTERTVTDTVIVRRRIVVQYVDELVNETPPEIGITIPPTQYRYVEAPRQTTYTSSTECVCYRPDGYTGPLYRYRYPNDQTFCVPPQMGDATIYPPGYGR